ELQLTGAGEASITSSRGPRAIPDRGRAALGGFPDCGGARRGCREAARRAMYSFESPAVALHALEQLVKINGLLDATDGCQISRRAVLGGAQYHHRDGGEILRLPLEPL